MSLLPKNKPQATQATLDAVLARHGVDKTKYPFLIVSCRGYFRDTMGKVGKNDRGIYDDAFFVIAPGCFVSFNGNTDPSKVRKGKGKGSGKGMASLVPGFYPEMWTIGHHKKIKPALRQYGRVTVMRDGLEGDYLDTDTARAPFMINGHPGGVGTSSEGCQTVPKGEQWKAFIALVIAQAKLNKVTKIPYLLIDEKIA